MSYVLASDRVTEVITDCLFKPGEPTDPHVEVEGIMNSYWLHPERLEQHRAEIACMLRQLPDPFHQGKGGGWSFLNACLDKDGHQWTGLHTVMEQLLVLGLGTGYAKYAIAEREMWPMLPGGVPYFVVEV